MNDLITSINSQVIEKVTGENQRTIKQWKKGTRKIPESVIRLLKLYIDGDASGLLGKDWEGFYFQDALFYVPEWRRGFTPHEIRALFWKCQQIRSLNNEINLLKQELERRNEEINTLEIKADFYRRQVVLESRFGLILERSFW
jgi:uncharacterized protein DUF3653